MKTVEQQEVIASSKGYYIATVEVTLRNKRPITKKILSLDSHCFETEEEADLAFANEQA